MSKPRPLMNLDEVVQLYAQGFSFDRVAAAVGISTHQVRTILRRAGVQSRRPGPPSAVSDEQILALRAQGLTWAQVGETVGMTTAGVFARWRRICAAGHADPKPPPRPVDVDRIVTLHAQGRPITAICVQVGYGPVVVSRALRSAGVELRRGTPRVVSEAQLLQLRAEGLGWGEIADRLGVSRSTVSSRWRLMRLDGVPDPATRTLSDL